jgi:hypothetical protein
MLAVARPKESKASLDPIPNTYAIPNGVLYDYYSIKFGERKGDFVEITKLPPTIQEGFVTFQKQLYRVSIRDYLRRRVNVGQPAYVTPTTGNAAGAALTNAAGPAPNVVNGFCASGQQGPGSATELQFVKDADVAWEEQVGALLYADDPEAEWEY